MNEYKLFIKIMLILISIGVVLLITTHSYEKKEVHIEKKIIKKEVNTLTQEEIQYNKRIKIERKIWDKIEKEIEDDNEVVEKYDPHCYPYHIIDTEDCSVMFAIFKRNIGWSFRLIVNGLNGGCTSISKDEFILVLDNTLKKHVNKLPFSSSKKMVFEFDELELCNNINTVDDFKKSDFMNHIIKTICINFSCEIELYEFTKHNRTLFFTLQAIPLTGESLPTNH